MLKFILYGFFFVYHNSFSWRIYYDMFSYMVISTAFPTSFPTNRYQINASFLYFERDSYAELQRIFKIMLPINLKGLHLMRTISQSLTQRTLVIHWKCSIEVYNSFHSTNQIAPFNKLAYAMWPAAGCKVPTCNLSTFDVTTCNMAITVAGYDSSVQPIRLFRSFNSPRQCYRICNMWWLQGPHL